MYGLEEAHTQEYLPVFNLLKGNNIKTAMFVDSYDSTIAALSIGGARRLSG